MDFKVILILAWLVMVDLYLGPAEGYQRPNPLGNECITSISQAATKHCRVVRATELQRKKRFYRISGPENEYGFPHLDQPIQTTLEYFLTEKFHSHWFSLYFNLMMKKSNSIIVPYLGMKYRGATFTSYNNYTQLAKEVKDVVLSATNFLPQFRYPSRSYEYFTDLTVNDRYKDDDYFAQQRLAGLNPMAIRRVVHANFRGKGTKINELFERLNTKNFDWDVAVISITKDRNMYESIYKNKIYVVEFPMLDGLTMMHDVLSFDRHNSRMKAHASPIALFAVDPEKKLRIVAIQNTSNSDGHVHTPRHGHLWNISKAQLQISDGFAGQVLEHLMKTHLRMEPFCVALQRHLSSLHPLHQIMKHHCRGLLPLNARGAVTLLKEERTIRSLFGYGNRGAMNLLRNEYPKMVWGDIDLEANIRERGMEDREQVPYYPYRDDGRIIDEMLDDFTKRLIRLFYRWDVHVRQDKELQNMITELSTKIRGFPRFVRTRAQLSKLIHQAIWIVVQHSVFSFPIAEYGATPVIFPTKLYESKTGTNENFIDMLPGPISAVLQASLASGLGSLHYDSFFDYWKDLKCTKLRGLVQQTYDKMQIAQDFINRENKMRFEKGQLTHPFMVPDWMPNSIST